MIDLASTWELLIIAIGSAALAALSWWTINSERSPFWRFVDRRPRRIEATSLAERFGGLARFGLEGAFLTLVECRSGDEVSFVKRARPEGFSFDVSVSSPGNNDIEARICSALMPLGGRLSVERISQEGGESRHWLHLSGEGIGDPSTLEGVMLLILRCLGHRKDAKYRVYFEGPADHSAVADYFSFEE